MFRLPCRKASLEAECITVGATQSVSRGTLVFEEIDFSGCTLVRIDQIRKHCIHRIHSTAITHAELLVQLKII